MNGSKRGKEGLRGHEVEEIEQGVNKKRREMGGREGMVNKERGDCGIN